MARNKGEAKKATVKIDDDFSFVIDGRSMTLYKTGTRDPIGFYSRFELMLHRIMYLNTVDAASKEGNINITRFLEILRSEGERVERLLKGVKDP